MIFVLKKISKMMFTSSLLLRSCPSFTVLSSFSFIIFRACGDLLAPKVLLE